jgi:hypothetical protein
MHLPDTDLNQVLEALVMTDANNAQPPKTKKTDKSIQSEQIDLGINTLTEMAKVSKKGFTLVMAIAKMLPVIEKAFAAGYTHQDICTALKENTGIQISPSTLKGYVKIARDAKRDGKNKKSSGTEQKPEVEMQFPQPPT